MAGVGASIGICSNAIFLSGVRQAAPAVRRGIPVILGLMPAIRRAAPTGVVFLASAKTPVNTGVFVVPGEGQAGGAKGRNGIDERRHGGQ